MAMKFVTTILGTGRPAEYSASYVELPLKEDLPFGTLVAVDSTGTQLERADQGKIPVGVAINKNVKGILEAYEFEGSRDNKVVKTGTYIPLYKQFLISGLDVTGELAIGAPVYLTKTGNSAELTVTKPTDGFVVGSVERVTDKLVRFDLTVAGALKLATSK